VFAIQYHPLAFEYKVYELIAKTSQTLGLLNYDDDDAGQNDKKVQHMLLVFRIHSYLTP
jgi:hypothetical protein